MNFILLFIITTLFVKQYQISEKGIDREVFPKLHIIYYIQTRYNILCKNKIYRERYIDIQNYKLKT